MPSSLGNIVPGFSPETLSFPRKQDESWTSTKGFGTARSCEKMNLFCVPMTRRVFRLGLGGTLPQAKLFGRCERKTGIAPFGRLVDQVMAQPPYKEARRVFWIVDNGSAHRGVKSVERLQDKFSNLALIHGPVHASWLNQIEIYFSVLQRKALTPNDFSSLQALEERIIGFQKYYEQIAKPFEWKFTRKDLNLLISKIKTPWPDSARLAA
jgi:hypothetical protein